MKIITLNIRGFNRDGKFGWVHSICKLEKPNILLLQETKLREVSESWIQNLWGSSNVGFIQKAAVGSAGGQLILWDNTIFNLTQAVSNDFFLAIRGQWIGIDKEIAVVNVYGPHDNVGKARFWGNLDNLLSFGNLAWVIGGDFNEVRFSDERLNCEFKEGRARMFNDFIDRSKLLEVPLEGKLFTRVSDDGFKFSKLDRFLVSEEFRDCWDDLSVSALHRDMSDHCPLMLCDKNIDFGPKPIRVFDCWWDSEEAASLVKEVWNNTPLGHRPDCGFRNKLKAVKFELSKWFKAHNGNIDEDIQSLRKSTESMECKAELGQLNALDHEVWLNDRKKLIEKELLKSSMLRQKAKTRWAVDGDENSRYFHSFVRRRQNSNNIRGLNINGNWEDDPCEVKKEAFRYYENLFKDPYSQSNRIPYFDNLPFRKLSEGAALNLEQPFDENEVWEAVKSCDNSKAPGPDGFNFSFIKKFWGVIKVDLLTALTWFWSSGEISRGCNASFISLIPKKPNVISIADYRPISLIGCYYKILAKILANRLSKVIPEIIGDEQNAFMRGRYILDGALIANEVIFDLKKKKRKSFIFKVDFEKAFDSLRWEYLFETMTSMGFGEKWRKWIHACLSSATISILVNGSPTEEFKITRDVRQGDPLSPFLFNIAAEGLNLLSKSASANGHIRGVKVGGDEITISHLQYADDTIYFGEWNRVNIFNNMKLLKGFELVSGLKVNFHKSFLYGIGIDNQDLLNMADRIDCRTGNIPFVYLGIPIGSKMNKSDDWAPVIEKFKSRLSEWRSKTLSFGGRLTLIKSVLSSLPLYYFSMYRAPRGLLLHLEKLRRIFFWGGSGDNSKLSWVKWDTILNSYDAGGLGIGSLFGKNRALLGKWWWRFKNENHSLWASVIKSIYGRHGGLDEAFVSANTSRQLHGSTWFSIIQNGFDLDRFDIDFKTSFKKEIGNGEGTKFWEDLWLGDCQFRYRFRRLFALESDKGCLVKDRVAWTENIAEFSGNWLRNPRGRTLGELQELMSLLATVSKPSRIEDAWTWTLGQKGVFTNKKLAELIDDNNLPSLPNQTVMRNNLTPKKLEVFAWRSKLKRLPILTELDKRNIDVGSIRCPTCDDDIETIDHAFIFCKHANEIWDRVHKWWKIGPITNLSIEELYCGNIGRNTSTWGRKLWQAIEWICGYFIWRNRNQKIFKKKWTCASVTLNEIQVQSFEWISKRSTKTKVEWTQWLTDPSVYLTS